MVKILQLIPIKFLISLKKYLPFQKVFAFFQLLVNNPLQNVFVAALLKDIIIHWLDLDLLSFYSMLDGGKKGKIWREK